MALISRKTDDEKAAELQARAIEQDMRRRRQQEEAATKKRLLFFETPAGRARAAFERGDQVFQYSANVMSQKAIIVAMVGSNTSRRTSDPSEILNSVCNEGWELVNGSFVFVETGQQSRDKFLASGQNVAVSGATVGYYLFRRSPDSKLDTAAEPWVTDSEND